MLLSMNDGAGIPAAVIRVLFTFYYIMIAIMSWNQIKCYKVVVNLLPHFGKNQRGMPGAPVMPGQPGMPGQGQVIGGGYAPAPQGGYQAPPPGYQAPPPGYQAPSPGYQAPGYQPQPQPGFQPPPPGYQAPPQ